MNFVDVIYRIGDDFSITAVRLSHRDYTDGGEKEKERTRERGMQFLIASGPAKIIRVDLRGAVFV